MSQKEKNQEYYTFLPSSEKTSSENIEKLNQFIQENCINIGLLGDYATGKSSIIEKFKSTKEDYYNIIEISSAIFDLNNEEIKDEDVDESNTSDQFRNSKYSEHIEIQKILIHQLHNILSEENYINEELKLKKKNKIKCPKRISFLLTVIGVLLLIFNVNSIQNIIRVDMETIQNINTANINLIQIIIIILMSILIVFIGIFLFVFINYLITSFNIKEIKTKNIKLENSKEIKNNGLVQNEYITKETQLIVDMLKEIFIEGKKKKLIVFIEDIDRHNNVEIFNVFYHISNILKASKTNFTFVYAVKPVLFKRESTKYFDAIIDVIPFYDRLTSADDMEELIKCYDESIVVSKKFLNNICYYISDYRDLLRITNLFISYKKKFEELKSNEKLLTIIILKILYPEYLNLKPLNVELDCVEKLLIDINDISNRYDAPVNYFFPEFIEDEVEDGSGNIYKVPIEATYPKEMIEDEQLQGLGEKIKSIKNSDKTLWNILEYVISNGYLDNSYQWIISTISEKYTENDRGFITNLLDGNGIYKDPNDFIVENIPYIIENFIEFNYLENKKELINISLLKYYIKQIKDENDIDNIECFNALITNIIRSDYFEKLLINNNKDIIGEYNSSGNLLDKQNTILILNYINENYYIRGLVSKYDENYEILYPVMDSDEKLFIEEIDNDFSIPNLLYCIKKNNMTDIKTKPKQLFQFFEIAIMFHKIDKYNNENYLNKTNLEIIIWVCNTYNIKSNLVDLIENYGKFDFTEIYDNELYIIEDEIVSMVIDDSRYENNKLFKYMYDSLNTVYLKVENLSIEVIMMFLDYVIEGGLELTSEDFEVIENSNFIMPSDELLNIKEFSQDIFEYIVRNSRIEIEVSTLQILDDVQYLQLLNSCKEKVVEYILGIDEEKEMYDNQLLIQNIILDIEFTIEELNNIVKKLQTFNIYFEDISEFEELDEEYLQILLSIIKWNNENIKYLYDNDGEMFFKKLLILNKEKLNETDFIIDKYSFLAEIIEDYDVDMEIKREVILKTKIQEQIKINELWNLEIVNFIIDNNKIKFDYDSLKEYKEIQEQELDNLKPIIDKLIGYTYNSTGENCYLSDGIEEKNQEVLQYIIVELEGDIVLNEYLEIVANNIMVISNIYEFIKDTIFSKHFLFLESVISGQFKNKTIPDELNNENGRKILKEICKEKGLKLTKKKINRKE